MNERVQFLSGAIHLTDEVIISKDSRGILVGLQNTSYPDMGYSPRLITIMPFAIRGNHFHSKTTEWAIVLNGRILFMAKEDDRKFQKEFIVKSPILFVIQPKITHAFKNVGKSMIYLYHHIDKPYDVGEPDVVENIILRLDAE